MGLTGIADLARRIEKKLADGAPEHFTAAEQQSLAQVLEQLDAELMELAEKVDAGGTAHADCEAIGAEAGGA